MDQYFGLSIRGVPITFGEKFEIILPEELGLYMAGLFVSKDSVGYPQAHKELNELVKAIEILQTFIFLHTSSLKVKDIEKQ